MKKLIGKAVYDTETATLIKKLTFGYYGDPAGYEETLYQTEKGLYFIYGFGGEASVYPKETIVRLNKEKAAEWIAAHC